MRSRSRVLQFAALLGAFLIAGLAVAGWLQSRLTSAESILAWFLGAILLHDLLFLPLYSGLDRLVFGSGRRSSTRPVRPPGGRPPLRPYIRIPAIISGLVLVVFAPEILRLGDGAFHTASGLHQDVYLPRYLIVCAAMFGVSAVAYGVTLIRHGAARARTRPHPRRSPPVR